MTNEEKQILLKDLCERLPYTPTLNILGVTGYDEKLIAINRMFAHSKYTIVTNSFEEEPRNSHGFDIEEIRLYLRPMSSMTVTEKNELRSLLWFGYPSDDFDIYSHRGIEIKMCLYDDEEKSEYDFEDFELLKDFLLKNHFDYCGLIEKGLALAAPDGMYN